MKGKFERGIKMGLMKQMFSSEIDDFEDYLKDIGIEVSGEEAEEVYYCVTFNEDIYGPQREGLCYLARKFMDNPTQAPNQVDNAMKKLILSTNMIDSNSEVKLAIKYVKKNGDIEEFIIKVLDIEDEICYAVNCKEGMTEMFHVDRITEVKEHNEDAGKDAV